MKFSADKLSRHVFLASAAFLCFCYGVSVGIFRIFPYQVISDAAQGYVEFCTHYKVGQIGNALPWYYRRLSSPYPPVIRSSNQAYQGLNLVARLAPNNALKVDVMDMDGRVLHTWDTDWFKLWPDAKHIPEKLIPRSPPGTHIHGCVVLKDGDLVFNFSGLGLVRLDRQNKVVWRLPYRTHHSIDLADDGNLWVCGQKEHLKRTPRFPNQVPPIAEDTILIVTPEGKIIKEWSVAEILRKNNLQGMLYLSSDEILSQVMGDSAHLNGDILHLNDVEPFPSRLKEGLFTKKDVLISLRNINTMLVFDRDTEKIKFVCTGMSIRQHDPDFIDGNSFSVFDNNVTAPDRDNPQSRITIISAPDKKIKTYYEGNKEHPFYSVMMGKHQWLPNGNLLITESYVGRAFEIDKKGEIVWEYINYVDEGVVGLLDEVQRLPPEYAKWFNQPAQGKSPQPVRAIHDIDQTEDMGE